MRTAFQRTALMILVLSSALRAQASAPATAANFLDVKAARAAIIDDSLDPYFEKLATAEMSAKTSRPITGDTPAAQVAECKRRYQDACRAFSAAEQRGLSAAVVRIQPLLQRDYPRFAAQPWSFIKLAHAFEGGMPHTRGRHIVIPERFAKEFTRSDEPPSHFLAILVHEQTHVVQRMRPECFEKMYEQNLGLTHAKRIESVPAVEDWRVVNPDGPVCDWVFGFDDNGKKRWIWPRLILPDPPPESLDVSFNVIELEQTGDKTFKVKIKNGAPVIDPMQNVKPFMQAMNAGFNSYHPNEVSAELFSRLFLQKCVQQREIDPDLAAFAKWAAETFSP